MLGMTKTLVFVLVLSSLVVIGNFLALKSSVDIIFVTQTEKKDETEIISTERYMALQGFFYRI